MPVLQPNSRQCFVCGLTNPFGLQLRFYNTAPGEVTADTSVAAHYQGYPGVVHGGVVAAMLDETAGRALMNGDPPRFMFTAKMSIRYRQNVPVDTPVRLVGKADKTRNRFASATSQIFSHTGALLAEAEVLLVDVPEDMQQSVDLDALGWKIYSPEERKERG